MDDIEKKIKDLERVLKWMRSSYERIPKDVLVSLCALTESQQMALDESLDRTLH